MMTGGYDIGISGSAASSSDATADQSHAPVTINLGGSEVSRTFLIVAGASVVAIALLVLLLWRK